MTSLVLEKLSKTFGRNPVVRDVSLTVEDGEFCVFVGPSGCGKSTLLRLIAGLEEASAGRVIVGGRDVTALAAYDRDLAMVFQSYALYPHMSVRENIAFPLRTAKRPEAEVAARIAEAARILKLQDLLDRKPSQLSGGQRQRVAIGRAIGKQPSLFLFDEPLSNLDAELRVHMRIEIARLHRELGSTVVYVTHDQVEAMTLAAKIGVLREGRVEQVGTPLHLYDDPDNIFVAGFIGSPQMNFFEARHQAGRLVLTGCDGQAVPVPALQAPLAEGQEVTVGLRPQSIGRGGANQLELVIELVEHLGSKTLVHARPRGAEQMITAVIEDGRSLQPGQEFKGSFNSDKLMLFGRGGERLR